MTDYSIASKVVPPSFDPLKTIGAAQSVQQGMLQNRLLGQNVAQTLAQRAAAQAAVGPDGSFDVDKYAGKLGEGGASPESMQGAQAMRLQQLQTKIAGLGLSKDQMALSAQELGNGAMVAQGVLANGTKDPAALSRASISAAIENNLIQPGLIKSPEGIAHAKALEGMMTDDPQKNAALLQQFVNQSTDITKALGAVNNVDTGSHIVQQRVNPATAESTVSGAISKERSPSEKAALVSVYDPATKSTKLVPSGQIVGDQPAAAGAPAAPQGGPALGEAEAAGGNVQQALALQNRASIVPQRRAALANLVNTLDKFNTGPKANAIGTLKGLAGQFGISTAGIDESKAAQDEFNKLASQIALDQWGALGGTGSNHQLETTMHANPNEVMSKMGIKNVAALLQGNEDAIGAQYDAWQKFKGVHGAASYDQFQQGWNKYYDPRVFQAEHMAPKDVRAMLAAMTPDERKTFTRDQNIAQQAGWLGK